VEISDLAKNRFYLHLSLMKAIILAVFALALLGGSACTRVHVSVRMPAGSTLTGLNCKLQRELRNQEQKTDFWCWAAAAHTVIEYLKQEKIQQCDLVQAVFKDALAKAVPTIDPISGDDFSAASDGDPAVPTPSDPPPHCCMVADKKPPKDTDPWYVKAALGICWNNGLPEMVFDRPEFRMRYEKDEYDSTNQGPQGLTWDEIVTEICEDRPIISTIAHDPQKGGGGHAVVIGGYKELGDGSQWVQVYDPGYSTTGDSYVWSYEAYLGDPGVFSHSRDYRYISVRH